jgi:hypothetical protein
MAEGKYRVFFDDGTYEDVTAENRDQAKTKARSTRIREIDPAGRLPRVELARDARVKIGRVAEHGIDQLVALLVAGGAALAVLLDLVAPLRAGALTAAGVLQVIGASGTAIGATIAALTAVTGDSLIIPFFAEAKKAWLTQVWCDVQAAGTLRIRSGKWHDDVQGIRIDTIASDPTALLPFGARQAIFSGDTLHVDLAGSATAGDIEYVMMLLYFEELSAQHARLLTFEQYQARAGNLMTAENTIATGATAAWAGSEAINAEIDQFHARSDYAILGYLVDTECAGVAWRGPDTANVRNGGPGFETQRELTADWFIRLARRTGLPCIPVISGDNKAATVVEALQDENGADTTLTTIMAELRPA